MEFRAGRPKSFGLGGGTNAQPGKHLCVLPTDAPHSVAADSHLSRRGLRAKRTGGEREPERVVAAITHPRHPPWTRQPVIPAPKSATGRGSSRPQCGGRGGEALGLRPRAPPRRPRRPASPSSSPPDRPPAGRPLGRALAAARRRLRSTHGPSEPNR